MANIKTICPHCKLEMEVDPSWIGQTAECPGCKNSFCIAPVGVPLQPAVMQPVPPPPGAGYQQQGYPQQPPPPKQNNTVLWIVLGVVGGFVLLLIVVVVLLLLPALGSAREKARRISCCSNMKQIMLACKMYSSDFGEKYPAGKYNSSGTSIDFSGGCAWAKSLPAPLDLLVTQNYNTDRSTYICPSTNGKACTYILVSSGFTENDDADLPILFELPSNHDYRYINVGYVDGSVRGVIIPKDCKTLEQVAEYLVKDVSLSSAKRDRFMRNVREAASQLKQ